MIDSSASHTSQEATPKRIVDMLNDLSPLQDIQRQLRDGIASSSEELTPALNNWLQQQNPKSLQEKKEITALVTLLGATLTAPLCWKSQECRLDAYSDPHVKEGLFRVRPTAAGNALITAKHISSILPISFER
jgi:hypothetical protein